MKHEERRIGQEHTRISLVEFLKSVGVQTLRIADDVVNTDAAYSEEWILQTGDRLAALSELAYSFYTELYRLEIQIEVEIPEGIVAVTVANPIHLSDRIDPSHFDDGSDADGLGELPF